MNRIRTALSAILCAVFVGWFAPDTAMAQAQDADAEAASPSSDFTFRRVKPPSKGTTKRITIQVERTWPFEPPKSSPRPVEEDAPVARATPDTSDSDWFWTTVSPALSAADPLRLDHAVSHLNANPDKKSMLAPTPALLDEIVKAHGQQILLASAGKRVSPALTLAVIAVESAGRTDALSEKGAVGLMQLIPATASRFGVKDSTDAVENIGGGVAYLDWLFGKFNGDPLLSLAGYNAGENAVLQNGGVPPYPETRAYVPKVVAAWERARMYCKTIPRFADDGCVFDINRSFSN